MATIISAPMGISESSLMSKSAPVVSSTLLAKRNDLKQMLISKLIEQHGSDPIKKAVITREVENSAMLRSGKLTSGGLAGLEKAVATAVRATNPMPMQSLARPRPPNPWSASEMAAKVKEKSNWTDVAMHRSNYYAIEQQRKEAEAEQRKRELKILLTHQMSSQKHTHTAQRQMVEEEAKEIAQNLKEFHSEMVRVQACGWPT